MGEREEWKEKEEPVGSLGSAVTTPWAEACGGQGSSGGAQGCFCVVTLYVGGGRRGLALLVIKSFLCHRDRSQQPGCGVAG